LGGVRRTIRAAKSAGAFPLKILCVDDEPAVLLTTALVVKSAGYDVLTATNVEEGTRLLCSEPIGLILLDCVPNRKALMLEAKKLGTPIILCTNRLSDDDDPDVGLVKAILRKPILPPELVQSIRKALPSS
jgi:DNA-binding response OmpR family regulator